MAVVVEVPVLLLLPLAVAVALGAGEVEAEVEPGTNSRAEGFRLLGPLPLLPAPAARPGMVMLMGWLPGLGGCRVAGAPVAYIGALPASAAATAAAAVAAATAELLLALALAASWLSFH